MRIVFRPARSDLALHLVRAGEVLLVNGTPCDFSGLAEGTACPPDGTGSPMVAGARRRGGTIEVEVILPHGPDAPEGLRDPAPVQALVDGPVPLPGGDRGETGSD